MRMKTTMRALPVTPRAIALLAVALLGGAISCGDDPTGPGTIDPPTPGTLTLSLDTPHDDDRALLVRIVGPDSMTAVQLEAAGVTMHTRGEGSDTLRIALFGALADGALLRFSVPDTRAAADYGATVLEASGPAAALRAPATGYGLTIETE